MKITIEPNWKVPEIEQAISEYSDIVFASGCYAFERPVRLNGLHDRTIIGEDGACFCGGKYELVSWEKLDGNMWHTYIGAGRKIDGLCIGDERFRQARYPHAENKNAIFEGTSSDALDFALRCAHPEDGVLHALHAHCWGDVHYRINGIGADGNADLIGGWQNNRPMGMHGEYRYVENLREALGAAGEFFYDVRTGELLICSDKIPQNEVLTVDNPYLFEIKNCHGIVVKNIKFENSARTFTESYEPLLRSDWCIHRGGAFYVEDCCDISVINCEFGNIGSNALFFSGNVCDCHVEECLIHDIGASGVCFVGRPSSVRYPCTTVDKNSFAPEDLTGVGPKNNEYVRRCSVVDCLIRDIGKTEKQTACVEISMSSDIRVAHCTMHTCPRAAVNVSEGTFGGHIIEYNDIFDTVRETGDHGSFNSWGRDRFWHAEGLSHAEMKKLAMLDDVKTTIIRGNRIRCDHGWDIDLDDGSSNYLIEDNLCLAGGLKFREGFNRTARHNRIINNTFHPHVWFDDSGDVFEENLVMRPYLPIGMPSHWGERINRNLLAVTSCETRSASELQQLSGQDTDSIAQNISFDENLRVRQNALNITFNEQCEYGVIDEKLRAYADKCPIDPPRPLNLCAESKHRKLEELEFKDIEDDGEMSAYATPGHHGVIVLSIAPHCRWYADGLRADTAIVTMNGTLLNGAEHMIEIYNTLKAGDDIVFGIRTMFNEAFEIHTKR